MRAEGLERKGENSGSSQPISYGSRGKKHTALRLHAQVLCWVSVPQIEIGVLGLVGRFREPSIGRKMSFVILDSMHKNLVSYPQATIST